MQFLYYVFGLGVLCLILYCLVCLNVSFSKLITSVGEERAVFSAFDYSYYCCFCSKAWCFRKAA